MGRWWVASAFLPLLLVVQTLASFSFPVTHPTVAPTQNLTGCYEVTTSNGSVPETGCGFAPLQAAKALLYVRQKPDGVVDACVAQPSCYRAAVGIVSNTSTGVGLLSLWTPPGLGNCSGAAHSSYPPTGLQSFSNTIILPDWPAVPVTPNATHVPPGDLSGVFVDNAMPAGTAGWFSLRPLPSTSACSSMVELSDCSAFPPSNSTTPTPTPTPTPTTTPAPTSQDPIVTIGRYFPPNLSGCWALGSSNGRCPGAHCGTAPASVDGIVYLAQQANGSVRACVVESCYRVFDGHVTMAQVAKDGDDGDDVSVLRLSTRLGAGNCSRSHAPTMPIDGLYSHFDVVVPSGWPVPRVKTAGLRTDGNGTLAGVFVDDGQSLLGPVTLNPGVANSVCASMRSLPDCVDFLPPFL